MARSKISQGSKPLNVMGLPRDTILLCGAVTLAHSPSLTIDPFNPAKFAVLVGGTTYLSMRYWRVSREALKNYFAQFSFLCSLIVLSLVLCVNHYSISERLFGFQGRNCGYITIVALVLLTLHSYAASRLNQSFLTSIIRGLAGTNLGVCGFFFLQNEGIISTNFENDYLVMPSTLGNPNFLSSFLGISTVAVLTLIFQSDQKLIVRLASISLATFSISVILKSGSIQGMLALGISCLTFFFFLTLKFSNRILNFSLFLILGMTSIVCFFGLLGTGPLGDTLRQQTFINRIVYWEVAIRIVRDSPLLGRGFDSYYDYYREYVTDSDFQRLGGPVISDSPHNVFLDLFVSGGLLLGSLFVLAIIFTFIRGFKKLKASLDSNRANPSQVFPFAVFVAFVSVCFISPFQMGLFVWLPLIIGVLLGDTSDTQVIRRKPFKINPNLTNKGASLFLLLSLIICNPYLAFLPMVTENRFRQSVETGNFSELKSVALAWPFSGSRAISVAKGFYNSTFNPALGSPGADSSAQIQALKVASSNIAVMATRINSRQYEAWKFLFETSTDASVKELARVKLVKLEPTNPNWKQTR